MVNFYRFYAKGIYAKLNIIVVQAFFSDEYWKKEFSYLYFKVNIRLMQKFVRIFLTNLNPYF